MEIHVGVECFAVIPGQNVCTNCGLEFFFAVHRDDSEPIGLKNFAYATRPAAQVKHEPWGWFCALDLWGAWLHLRFRGGNILT